MAYGIELRAARVLSNTNHEQLILAVLRPLRMGAEWLLKVITRLFSTDLDNVAHDNIVWCLILTVVLLVLTLI